MLMLTCTRDHKLTYYGFQKTFNVMFDLLYKHQTKQLGTRAIETVLTILCHVFRSHGLVFQVFMPFFLFTYNWFL